MNVLNITHVEYPFSLQGNETNTLVPYHEEYFNIIYLVPACLYMLL